jgi:hypothetical protein
LSEAKGRRAPARTGFESPAPTTGFIGIRPRRDEAKGHLQMTGTTQACAPSSFRRGLNLA